ncbi:MAG: hypothetical protein IPK26_20385 [Planctomycetes bacterium]|nr:hypothetical protein [Planctomycetota bacterium]
MSRRRKKAARAKPPLPSPSTPPEPAASPAVTAPAEPPLLLIPADEMAVAEPPFEAEPAVVDGPVAGRSRTFRPSVVVTPRVVDVPPPANAALEPSPWPGVVAVAVAAIGLAGVLWACPAVDEWLATRWALGSGMLPAVVAAVLLFVPTPLASLRAGRGPLRIGLESVLLALGGVSTVHLLVAADLSERDDAMFMLLAGELAAAPILRVWLAPRWLAAVIHRSLRRQPRGQGLRAWFTAFADRPLPAGLPPLLYAADPASPFLWVARWLGRLHRCVHGRPTVPTLAWLAATRRALTEAGAEVGQLLRTANAPDLTAAVARLLTAWVAVVEAQTLGRLVDRRAWPTTEENVDPDDLLFADFEAVLLRVQAAAQHPARPQECDAEPWIVAVVGSLDWSLGALGIDPVPGDGTPGLLRHACQVWLQGDAEAGLRTPSEFGEILRPVQVRSLAEHLATGLLAHVYWQQGLLEQALAVVDRIEFADRPVPLLHYLRSRVLLAMAGHDEALLPQDHQQIQALAADDALRAAAPELYWEAG